MPIKTRASKIQGQIGVDVAAAGTGEAVVDAPSVTEAGPLVFVGEGDEDEVEEVDVAVVVVVDVEVTVEVEVEVFVDVLAVEDEVEDVDVGVRVDVAALVGATPVGGVDVSEVTGVRVGSAGRLTEREALGRFEPPPHAAMSTNAIAQIAIHGPIRLGLIPSSSG